MGDALGPGWLATLSPPGIPALHTVRVPHSPLHALVAKTNTVRHRQNY